jgi:hypothetical protein
MGQLLLRPEDAGSRLYSERSLPSPWTVAIVLLLRLACYMQFVTLFDSTVGSTASTAGRRLSSLTMTG